MRESIAAASPVVFFGTHSPFSLGVLRTLLAQGVNVVLAAVPGPAPAPSPLPVMISGREHSVVSLAAEHRIAVHHVLDFHEDATLGTIEALRPGFLLVACFPLRLPPALCRIPSEDALNLHPSLLPCYRGPAPLFWQLRVAEPDTGVTLHRLSQRLDSGDIVAQAPVSWPDGWRDPQIQERLAVSGARLFVEAMTRYAQNAVVPRVQDSSRSSYFRSPMEEDFRVSADWEARRLFNFMRGTEAWGRSYAMHVRKREWRLRKALSYVAEGRLGSAFEVSGREIRVQCRPGVLHATFDP